MCSPMPPSNTWVLKLGGAMHGADELPAWLAACGGEVSRATRCVVVAGGGAFADQVRALQARWRFDEHLAHALALDTMRLNARLLHGLAPHLTQSEAVHAAALAAEGDVMWSPPADFAPTALPASWAVTSDSIALWLAQALGAQAVLLVKSLAPEDLQAGSARQLAARGVVDDFFPALLSASQVPARLLSKTAVGDFARHLQAGSLPGVRID